jgi:hypothetical protein
MVGVSNIVNAADLIEPVLLASEPECFESEPVFGREWGSGRVFLMERGSDGGHFK